MVTTVQSNIHTHIKQAVKIQRHQISVLLQSPGQHKESRRQRPIAKIRSGDLQISPVSVIKGDSDILPPCSAYNHLVKNLLKRRNRNPIRSFIGLYMIRYSPKTMEI